MGDLWLLLSNAIATYAHALFSRFSVELIALEQTDAAFRLGVAAVCGFLVGIEREHASKPAGVRTNVMICVGSALFTLASILAFKNFGEGTDPTRIAAQVVSGVGFLGAGVILKTGFHIVGMTTAATIWLVSAIGVSIGLGFPLLGLFSAVASAITLYVLGKFEFTRWLPHPRVHNAPGNRQKKSETD